ncbi:hypothetical protein ACQE3D_14385 [Methylomonas sp. MS20]|uniref:hypothetical protein n=1 Tax=unclassified Methylomonas TaxID=2608980 RepID=UPI0028A500F5|nr:hypothetical protein [Methylomonas sp. MV1]MDT4331444.1 hypothetical protein [Methylomonas sp. MV1]
MTDHRFEGLRAAQASFPRSCRTCGRVYNSAEDFLAQTVDLPAGNTGLREMLDDDDQAVVAVFRNCVCGSTLMDEFQSRRDDSPEGRARRAEFARREQPDDDVAD